MAEKNEKKEDKKVKLEETKSNSLNKWLIASVVILLVLLGFLLGKNAGLSMFQAFSTGNNQTAPTPTPTPDYILAGAGDIGYVSGGHAEDTAKILEVIFAGNTPGVVFTTGDNMNEGYAPYSYYTDYFDKSWGRLKSLIRPAPGNHDFAPLLDGTSSYGSGYFGYFNNGSSSGPAGDSDKGWYSYNLGNWHIIVLNSSCEKSDVYCGGLGTTADKWAREIAWLKADLEANKNTVCTAAFWHRPRYSSGEHGDNLDMIPFWNVLYQYGADFVANGHDHDYERFALQDPNGNADPGHGIREFVVGTGGGCRVLGPNNPPNLEVKVGSINGVLKLTLHSTSYDWQFISTPDKTFTDSGSQACH